MKSIGVVIYFASLFLLYISAGMGVAITLASVVLGLNYPEQPILPGEAGVCEVVVRKNILSTAGSLIQ